MENIYMKIRGQPCTFIRNFQKTQASNSIPATFAFFNGVLQSRLGPQHQGSASTPVTTMPSKVPSKKGNAIDEVLILLYAVTSIMTTAPINRVMHLMRCQNEMIKSGRLSHPYKGFGDCFARTVRNEGVFSLWKGNTAYMMGLMTDKFIFGSAMDNCLSLFNYKKEDSIRKKLPLVLAAECLSRAVTLFFSHPLEYSQTRMANDIKNKSIFGKGQFNGIFDVFRKTLKSDGIARLYRGYNMTFFASFVSDLPFFALKPKGELLEMLGLQHNMLAITMVVTGHYLLGNLITNEAGRCGQPTYSTKTTWKNGEDGGKGSH
ncbi:hypothetical protein EZV62_026713 [Acer yangbiense]|uniref:ADP/ATP translocase n=1 Tax=Acer yangbiense TaxID=1000413 RepID=A0A5C7GSH0_9ROSI|nr:hypothetical protein EZV62_026713 [Acer yangbiense]